MGLNLQGLGNTYDSMMRHPVMQTALRPHLRRVEGILETFKKVHLNGDGVGSMQDYLDSFESKMIPHLKSKHLRTSTSTTCSRREKRLHETTKLIEELVQNTLKIGGNRVLSYSMIKYSLITKSKGNFPWCDFMFSSGITFNGQQDVGDSTYFVSKIFTCQTFSDYLHSVVLVRGERNVFYPRLCYLSSSSAMWRVVDKVFLEKLSSKLYHIGKSYIKEGGMTLPFQVSQCLNLLHAKEKPVKLSVAKEEFVKFIGGIAAVSNRNYKDETAYGVESINDEENEPVIIKVKCIGNEPSRLSLKGDGMSLDWTSLNPLSHSCSTMHYSQVRFRTCLTVNKQFRFVFADVFENHHLVGVFVASIEVVEAGVTKYGIFQKYVRVDPRVMLPLAEYKSNLRKRVKEGYIDGTIRSLYIVKAGEVEKNEKEELTMNQHHFSNHLVDDLRESHFWCWGYLKSIPFIREYIQNAHHMSPM